MSSVKVFRCPDCNMPLMPGDMSCLKCGKRFAQPVPKVSVAPNAKAQTEFQDPILAGTEYLCPKCQTVLEAGINRCSSCGVPFAYPVPAYKMPLQEAARLRQQEEEQNKAEAARQKAEADKLKAEAKEQKNEEARQRAEALKRKFAEAVKSVPGTYEEQEAYNQARVQEATARIRAEREAKEREEAAYAEAHSCPQCHTPKTPGNYVCISCGAIFNDPAAQPGRQFKTLVEKPASPLKKTLLSFVALLVIAVVGAGIKAIVSSSHSQSYASASAVPSQSFSPTPPPMQPSSSAADLIAQGESYYEHGRYTDAINSYQTALANNPSPDMDADLRRRIAINQQLLAQGQQPVSPQQPDDPQFADDDQDARNKFPGSSADYDSDFQMLASAGMGKDAVAKVIGASAQASSMTGTNINTLIYVAHAYYVREPSTSERTQAMEQDMNTLAICEAKEPGIGVFQLAKEAADGASPEYVAQKSQALAFDLSGVDMLHDQSPSDNYSSMTDTIWKLVANKPH